MSPMTMDYYLAKKVLEKARVEPTSGLTIFQKQ